MIRKHGTRAFRMILSICLMISLILPSTAFAEDTGGMSTTGNESGSLQVELLPGVQVIEGKLQVSRIDLFSNDTLYLKDGNHFDISSVPIDPSVQYLIQLQMEYADTTSQSKLIYYDDQEISGRDLLTMSHWNLDSDRKVIQPDAQAFPRNSNAKITYIIDVHQSIRQSVTLELNSAAALITSPRHIEVQLTESLNEIGYHLQKDFSFNELTSVTESVYYDFSEEKNTAASLPLPSNVTAISVFSDERQHQSNFNPYEVKEIKFPSGKQNIYVTTPIKVEGLAKEITWRLNRDVKPGDSLSFTGTPTHLLVSNFNYDNAYKTFNLLPTLQSGDFEFKNNYFFRSQYQVKLKQDKKDLQLKEVQFKLPSDVSLRTQEPVTSGDYTAEVTFNMNGTTIQGSSNVLRLQLKDSEIGGLPVTLQNEKGQRLSNGSIQLFEKQNYGIENNEIVRKVFQNKIQDGSSFIPHAYLLNGKQYQLLVQAEAEDGSPIIYHRTFIAGQEGELSFTSKQLNQLKINQDSQITADLEQFGITLLDEQGTPLTSTVSITRDMEQGESTIRHLFIATEAQMADLQFNLYHSATDAGYYDRRHQFRLSNSTMSVNLLDDLAKFTFPSSLIGSISMDTAIVGDQIRASKYFIQKGSLASVDYHVEKNGYRYFIYGYYDVKSNVQFPEKILLEGKIHDQDWYGNRVLIQFSNLSDNLNISSIQEIQTNQTIFRAASQSESTADIIPVPASEAVEYQLYDQLGNKLGKSVRTNLYQFVLNTNVIQGSTYRVKLEKQLIPNDLLELSMDDTFVAEKTTGTLAEIPIQAPTGEKFMYNDRANRGEIWEINKAEDGFEYVSSSYFAPIENNKLTIPNGIQNDKEYIVHLVMKLANESLYYKQLSTTGKELLNLQEINASNQLITYKQNADKMERELIYIMGIPSITEKLRIISYVKLITDVPDIDVQTVNVVGSVVYHLSKSLHSNGSKEIQFSFEDEQKAAVPVTIQKASSQASFIAFYEMINGIYTEMNYSSLYPATAHTLLTNPGEKQYGFITLESRPHETPWAYTWQQRNPISIQGETTLRLSDKIEKSFEHFELRKDEKNQYIVNSMVHLASGDFTLSSLGVYREYLSSFSAARSQSGPAVSVIKPYEGKFDLVNQVYPTIIVKDATGKVVYQKENNYLNYFEISLPSNINPGTYTLTYQLPTGPRESLDFSKTFVIPGNPGNGGESGNNGGGGTGGGGSLPATPGGSVPADVKPDTNKETLDIISSNVPQAVNGKVTIKVTSNEVSQVQLPGNIHSLVGDHVLVINTSIGNIEIPSSVLKQLSEQTNAGELTDSKVNLKFKTLTKEATTTLLNQLLDKDSVNQVGQIVEFSLSIITKMGKETPLVQFSKPITVRFKVTDWSDPELIGIFDIDGNNGLSYVGGARNGDDIVAELTHFGKFGALKLNKTFTDVPATHWAYKSIRELTAKQITKGLTNDQFGPNREITRAEFVQFLVKALHLTSTTTPTFKDVPATSWYADAVAAGIEHGLVKGLSADTFGPNQAITREEMAVIVTNAYRKMTNKELPTAVEASFTDRAQANSWAQTAIDQAAANQLLQGSNVKTFAPKQHATRAEAAKVILNLLAKK